MDKNQTERECRKQIRKLLKASTPAERQRIRKAQCEGRRLRKQLEELEQDE